MIARERQQRITDLLRTKKLVSAQELAAEFGVSIVTIRRDLDHLVSRGVAARIYGGAALAESAPAESGIPPERAAYFGRTQIHRAEKAAIARRAAELVQEGETIFIDRGTTTAELARALRSKRCLTVVTSSLAVMNELCDCEHIMVYCLGGMLRGSEASLTGSIAMEALKNFYLDRAFVGAAGVTVDGGMTEYYYDTVDLRRLAMERSRQVVLMADSSKFGMRTFAVVDGLNAVDAIVTDPGIPADCASLIEQLGVSLLIANPDKS